MVIGLRLRFQEWNIILSGQLSGFSELVYRKAESHGLMNVALGSGLTYARIGSYPTGCECWCRSNGAA